MPIYEFKCNSCAEKFEKLLSINYNKEELECPSCGGNNPGRLMSAFAATGTQKPVYSSAGGGSSACTSCSSKQCSTCH